MGNSFEKNCISNIPALSIAQLIHFNTARNRSSSDQIRHTASAETPLPIYVALLIHAHTRSRYLIDKLYELGLSISYSRMLTISASLGNVVCQQFKNDGLVCPSLLRQNVFTTHAIDNIDYNPSSRTATDSWHGTAIFRPVKR